MEQEKICINNSYKEVGSTEKKISRQKEDKHAELEMELSKQSERDFREFSKEKEHDFKKVKRT